MSMDGWALCGSGSCRRAQERTNDNEVVQEGCLVCVALVKKATQGLRSEACTPGGLCVIGRDGRWSVMLASVRLGDKAATCMCRLQVAGYRSPGGF